MKAIIGEPIKLHFRNSYEGGFQGPCTAEMIDVAVLPPERGTYSNGVFTPLNEGECNLKAQFVYSDGTNNEHTVHVVVLAPATERVEVPVPPKLMGGSIFDPEM